MSAKDNVRTVYSTATDGKCPVCGWPQRSCMCGSQTEIVPFRRKMSTEPVSNRFIARFLGFRTVV